jgi:hypothetical protein
LNFDTDNKPKVKVEISIKVEMKNKTQKYHTVGTVKKSTSKIIRRDEIGTHIM